MLDKIVLASNNAGKVKEFNRLFENLHIQIVPQGELGVDSCAEPFNTFLENALVKARHASKMTGLPALADDSGICAYALKGAPGVWSARYAGEPKSDLRNNEKLAQDLKNQDNKQVAYYCVLVLVLSEDDPKPLVADGVWLGQWQEDALGDNGFGYDPHFYVASEGLTVAQMPEELKNALSHRALAMQTLLEKIQKIGQV